MIDALFGEPRGYEDPRPPEWNDFLLLWNHLQESFVGDAKNRLIAFAHLCHVDRIASALLKSGTKRERLIAISSLGHLKDKSAWASLHALMTASDPVVALVAARAMVQIDPRKAMPLLVPQITTRREWPPSKIAAILKEAGPEVISNPLAAAALYASPEDAPRVIRFLPLGHHATIAPTIHRILEMNTNPHVIVACLEALSDPIDLHKVRLFIGHDHWRVRMAAAAALGRVGTKGDVPLLIDRLSDNNWWVRYTAARSLAKLPWMNSATLRDLQKTRPTDREQAVLRHVIAELGTL